MFSTLLTHYQATNFRLFQTERVCRRQFQIWWKWQKVIQTGRKHGGKRRNCSLRAIFSFSQCFQRLVSQGHQEELLCGNGLKTEIIIWATFTLSSANAFNLVTSKILLFGIELSCYNQMLFYCQFLPKLQEILHSHILKKSVIDVTEKSQALS